MQAYIKYTYFSFIDVIIVIVTIGYGVYNLNNEDGDHYGRKE